MDVYQCPGCKLRFALANELLNHITLDHPNFDVRSKSEEDELLSAAHRHRHAQSYRAGNDKNAP
ncbi:MAG: hypothetical protein ACRDKT_12465 [Actinomycetota bacterium]